MTALEVGFAATLGAAFGSFLNVVIWRVPRAMSVVRPPSSCPVCGMPVKARDNVPLVSFLLLRGRCRTCRARIPARYPAVEAGGAAIFTGAVLRFHPLETAAFFALATCVLGALSVIDFEHRRLPDPIVLPSILGAFLWTAGLSLARGDPWPLVRAVGCGGAFFALLFLIAAASRGMGFGDVKLAGFIGLVTGRLAWQVTVGAALAAFVGGGVVALGLLVTGKRSRKDALPFGPALAAGAVVAVFAGRGAVHAVLGL